MNLRIIGTGMCLVLFLPLASRGQDKKASNWADKKVSGMKLDEKVGQLFMVAAYSNKDEAHINDLLSLVKEHSIGGVIFFQGEPIKQVEITNRLQKKSKIPLMVGIDAEWGLSMRLSGVTGFPKQLSIAAAGDTVLMYKMGKEVARQCKRLGIHVNFAPVVDVNINSANPVIGVRSFGQDKNVVSSLGIAYMNGLQHNNVMACAKHFPGHGDTDMDSHKTLPTVFASLERLSEIELEPFRRLIDAGVQSVMAAHLHVPVLGTDTITATSLTPSVINGLLREKLNFNGLVFSDALNMKGVSNYHASGELELKALIAGNDVLLFSEDVEKAKARIIEAVESGEIEEQIVDQACKRILMAKHRIGLNNKVEKIETDGLSEDLNSINADLINRRLVEKSITLLKNSGELLPLKRLDTLKIAAVSIGADLPNSFLSGVQRYSKVATFSVPRKLSESKRQALLKSLGTYDLVLIGVHANSISNENNYGIDAKVLRTVRDINIQHKTVVSVFANPYSLNEFFGLKDVAAVVMSYEDNETTRDYTSQAIFGGIGFSGTLPVDASPWFKLGSGIKTQKTRLKYSIPSDMGMNSLHLLKIDSLASVGIFEGAYPGCQILVAKGGTVIYEKSFGHHTYDEKRVVSNQDIYDLASVTKIAATTASVMRLTDENKISIDNTLGEYIPRITGESDYKNVVLREMMSHQAGFFPWIPFYYNTLSEGKPDSSFYHRSKDSIYSKRVADKMYASPELRDSILARIIREPIHWRKKYKYSDFGFYLLHKITENITHVDFESYTDSVFYQPLGLSSMTFRPREKFSLDRITPTEDDTVFRMQLIHGDVHDQGAAMMGGVSGHAGLFSNANDLAIMMQMFVNGGEYGGERYISDTTLADFTRCQYCNNDNRRGAGFDKPVRGKTPGPTCGCVSHKSFGHTGFTGITAWADPAEEVVYIFLSNRVYPIADNKKILRLNTRTDIQQVIYDSIKKGPKNEID